jgi:hypothetical protein
MDNTPATPSQEKPDTFEAVCFFVNSVVCTGLVLFFAVAIVAVAEFFTLPVLLCLVPLIFVAGPIAGIIAVNKQALNGNPKDKFNGRASQVGIAVGAVLTFLISWALLLTSLFRSSKYLRHLRHEPVIFLTQGFEGI